LQNQVVLLGSKPHDEIPVIMQECDVLVAATRTLVGEGRCMTVMESMVAGTPVIAPDHTAFPFLIKDGVNGLLYEPDSVNDLNKKISKVLYDGSFHSRLKEGAAQYGLTLLEPPMTFSQAVFKAFKNKH
ncbi:MAG TPA: glycosyltransferase, partial [Crenotrichaceae bacterium]|nr:glycosyltransferase [Crenotrichaceae bacterium]